MSELVEATPTVGRRPRRRRWLWITVAAVLVLSTGGVIAAVAVSFHYLHAPGLQAGGSFGWLPPDNLRTRFADAADRDVLVTPARPNHWQTFSFQVSNPSSVTQTILGQEGGSGATGEPERVTVSTTSTAVGDEMAADYTADPVAIPPGGIRTVRLSHYAGGCEIWGTGEGSNGRSEYWTSLDLRVRVGAFTRTERVDFGGSAFELQGTGGAC